MKTLLSPNFSIEEFEQSDTAKRLGITNRAPEGARLCLAALCQNVLQPLRDAYGKRLFVSSGFRCETLNNAVGGVPNSQHLKGEAADIAHPNPQHLLDILLRLNIPFDQAILYPKRFFIHLSYKKNGHNRKEILHM